MHFCNISSLCRLIHFTLSPLFDFVCQVSLLRFFCSSSIAFFLRSLTCSWTCFVVVVDISRSALLLVYCCIPLDVLSSALSKCASVCDVAWLCWFVCAALIALCVSRFAIDACVCVRTANESERENCQVFQHSSERAPFKDFKSPTVRMND